MPSFETVDLTKDVDVTLIPSGERSNLKKGTRVHITQSLGGAFTVMTEAGYMVRIQGDDHDALGKDKPEVAEAVDKSGKELTVEEQVWNQLKTVYDPEIPVDIVSLGLVYECKVTPSEAEEGKYDVYAQMTLTAPGCGMGESLKLDAKLRVETVEAVREAKVDLVWEPQWDRSMMSEAAKLKLGVMD